MTRIPACLTLLLALALCGCGNKGPLVRPPPDEAPEAPTPAASDAGAEADPPPAGQTDDASVPVEPESAAPPDDATDDDPPG